ncbi:cytochrome c [Roseinatronobacter thiooxidans]|uniref:Cytochrome c n=1 Tax=Roseinatronobacter thiooxidans TaxID=121821 RepID=A0A2W7Q8H8_9RHOB|nr:c-type cytochrome [Roseinatronobacter thiooxidans]PZX42110.1 cytochrome c [Roseinatronobacter thiooxidans]
MFDTMVLTKAVAAFCGALLVFLLGNWAASGLYVPRNAGAQQAFIIDTGADDVAAEPVAELTFEEAFEVADAAAGSRLWSQCRACHALEEGRNGVGPYLHGVVNRSIGAVDGFNYSGALNQAGDAWTPAVLSEFLLNPSALTPGTSMSYRGMASTQDRANLIAYIESES